MDYTQILAKLEKLRNGLQQVRNGDTSQEIQDEIAVQYGEVEEIIHQVLGIDHIEVPLLHSGSMVCRNYIEAGYFSGRTIHRTPGYKQLLKVIGKVKQLTESGVLLEETTSRSDLLQILKRFRECCQHLKQPLENEKDVQDIIWIMLRSQFDRVEREVVLPMFGTKTYRPDFGLPDLSVLVEVKFIGLKTSPAVIQEGILADIPGYLQESSPYTGIVVLVYDDANKLLESRRVKEDLGQADGILEVIIVPSIRNIAGAD